MAIEKLTQEAADAMVEEVEYSYRNRSVICTMTLSSGFVIVGTAGCMRDEDYDQAKGEEIARDKCTDQLFAFEAYRRVQNEFSGD